MTGTDLIPVEVIASDIDITPMQANRWLLFLGRQLRDASLAVEETRKVELEMVDAYDRARRRTLLSPDCPVVGRGPGEWTVAYRDAWVDTAVEAEKFQADVAKAAREAAVRMVNTINDQIRLIQTIAGLAKAELRAGAR